MLQLKKCPPFEATILLAPDPSGIDSIYTIIKGTFSLENEPRPAVKQLSVVAADKHYGDAATTSIQIPGDVGLCKPGTDVLLIGNAHAQGGRPIQQMDVTLNVGEAIRKTVRVFGDRVWRKRFLGTGISDAKLFTTMPLTWERAFGGADAAKRRPSMVRSFECNPAGTGFRIAKGTKRLDGLMLPNIEDPRMPLRLWTDSPNPASFAPVSPHWHPRKGFAGTYDKAWQSTRAPFLPEDFNPRFFQLAPVDQICAGYLRGGEPAEARGVTPAGVLRFRVPRQRFEVIHRFPAADEVCVANLDTLIIEPDESRLVALWRTALPCDKRAMSVREIVVTQVAAK